MRYKLQIGLAILLIGLFGATRATADELQPGVARLSLIHGEVSTQRGDTGDWVAGTLNTPIVAGDHVSTGTRSRAELQLDYANILRLDERTQAKVAELTRTRIQVQVGQGVVNYTVFKGNEADVEIDTPNAAVHPLGEGVFRVHVFSEEESQVIVRDGEAEITTPQGSTRLKKNQIITIRGRDNPEYQTGEAPHKDSWDEWNQERDRTIWNAESWNHTNRYYTGAGDLDRYGRWVYAPGYDMVWMPTVGPDWVPYRDGRWVWEPFYGWTWVSYEPWGWAPYHYGRWFLSGRSWCWWPGPIHRAYYPLWAPAYVSFIGFGFSGRHFSMGFGIGFGSVGWLPIGPSDAFYPWWGAHRRTFNVINITNITNVRNVHGYQGIGPLGTGRPVRSNLGGVLHDARLQRSITSMRSEQFGRMAVPRNPQLVSATSLRQGQVMAGNLPFAPTRESMRPVDRGVHPSTLPVNANRPERFFTRSQAAMRQQASPEQGVQTRRAFEPQRGAALAGRSDVETRGNPSFATNRAAPQTGPSAERQGWRRFGGDEGGQAQRPAAQPNTQNQNPPRANQQPATNAPGWQKFPGRDRSQRPDTAQPQQPATRYPGRSNAPAAEPQQRPSDTAPARPGWQRFTPQPQSRPETQSTDRRNLPGRSADFQRAEPREWRGSASSGAPRSSARPALELRRPIVTPRTSGSSGGGYRSTPRGGSQSAPRGGNNSGRGSSRPAPRDSRPHQRR
jgi:hypothetical protein